MSSTQAAATGPRRVGVGPMCLAKVAAAYPRRTITGRMSSAGAAALRLWWAGTGAILLIGTVATWLLLEDFLDDL